MKKKWKYIIIIFCVVLIISYFYLAANYKDNLFGFEAFIKDKLLLVENFLTPKVNIDNSSIVKIVENDKDFRIKELESLLELNSNTSYSIVNSAIISRNVTLYSNEVVIDKGKRDGIEKDMAVINNNGLIGIVKYSFENTSVIELLSSNNVINISVSIGKYNAIVDGFDVDNNYVTATCIRSNSSINVGDFVYTNGYGKIIPKGIYVGEVVSVSYDDNDVNKVLKIKSDVDFNNIKYVSIIRSNHVNN